MAEVYCNKYDINEDGISPEDKFSNDHSVQILTEQHAWGCPVYKLDAHLQDRYSSVPKWDPRARLGIYLGASSAHAGNVHLVLNPRTGHVSPQYHVMFDNTFSTVPHLRSGMVLVLWKELVELNGTDLKGTLPETTWELPDESSSTIPPTLNLPCNDESNNKVLQSPSQPINNKKGRECQSQGRSAGEAGSSNAKHD
eukprot:8896889-Ditylum_brightwellii.AAC.1